MARGFLAMEYWGLILNRSFAVFVSPGGLHGWKFKGIASALNPFFFAPYERVVLDPDPAVGSEGFHRLMEKRGSFFIARDQIASATFDPTPKWGMGNVPHTDKVLVHLKDGRSREFILLGYQDGQAVCSAIMSGGAVAPAAGDSERG